MKEKGSDTKENTELLEAKIRREALEEYVLYELINTIILFSDGRNLRFFL